jgi:hypothetical protein
MTLTRGWAAGNAGPEDALRAGAALTNMSASSGTCQVPYLKHATGLPVGCKHAIRQPTKAKCCREL